MIPSTIQITVSIKLCVISPFVFDMTQVYDRDLTSDDFMGSASVLLSDLGTDK